MDGGLIILLYNLQSTFTCIISFASCKTHPGKVGPLLFPFTQGEDKPTPEAQGSQVSGAYRTPTTQPGAPAASMRHWLPRCHQREQKLWGCGTCSLYPAPRTLMSPHFPRWFFHAVAEIHFPQMEPNLLYLASFHSSTNTDTHLLKRPSGFQTPPSFFTFM